ncbi:hypothetical protein N7931_00815 [Catenovulum sp. 2E275]|uniref:hypothetical protein n=1 Tax=Catenovulum sp. 2E275 TaxID=2980497 RepID=UPI0021D02669|nr:hypothetical protein [Catenovulum sp. 2E275]MCU4674162.1 hypothetical protein [Catenovulum sp. 2E275]
MKPFIVLLALLLPAYASNTLDEQSNLPTSKNSTQVSDQQTGLKQEQTTKEDDIPESERIYYFEHKLLPKWTYATQGSFFEAMMNGHNQQFIAAATEIVSAQYAEQIKILPYLEENAILLIFATPKTPPNCYFVMIQKSKDSYIYHTYERTLAFGEYGFVGVVGGWNEGGEHLNMGPRKYSDYQSFANDVLTKLE